MLSFDPNNTPVSGLYTSDNNIQEVTIRDYNETRNILGAVDIKRIDSIDSVARMIFGEKYNDLVAEFEPRRIRREVSCLHYGVNKECHWINNQICELLSNPYEFFRKKIVKVIANEQIMRIER
jgi:hypothetical protein